jgi:hypothetical protein
MKHLLSFSYLSYEQGVNDWGPIRAKWHCFTCHTEHEQVGDGKLACLPYLDRWQEQIGHRAQNCLAFYCTSCKDWKSLNDTRESLIMWENPICNSPNIFMKDLSYVCAQDHELLSLKFPGFLYG